ncbi:MAG: hypothetical protein RM338_02215 [Nostoc sp. DedQUE12a]|nr:hypothetical protein [Nostoc sp. DedQUE12a]
MNNPKNCRCASRNNNTRDNHNNNTGFRIVCAAGMSLHRESRQVGICP